MARNEQSKGEAGHPESANVSAVLRTLADQAQGETIFIKDIIDAFGERAFGFVLILFSLPNCVPAPPGIAGLVGTPVLLFGVQMILGSRKPWLPEIILNRTIPVSTLRRVVHAAEPRLRWLEGFCRPRLTRFFGPLGDRFIGLFAVLVALCVLVPFPGTNFPPSIALVIVSIAMMEKDGYLLIAGLIVGLAGIAYTATVLGASYRLIRAAVTRWI